MPDWTNELEARLASLRLTPAREKEIIDELSEHLELRYAELRNQGVAETEALALVRAELLEEKTLADFMRPLRQANVPPVAPVPIGAPRLRLFADLRQDVRYALRQLVRSPGFTAVAVLTLALGIGANTAIFSAIDAILLKPLPYPDAERIVTVWQREQGATERDLAAPGNFLDWRERSTSFEALAAAEPYSHGYLAPDGPETLRSWVVTENFFDVVGVPALLGRTLRPEDNQRGEGARARVAVLGYGLWQRRFGGDPGIVGQALTLDGEPVTVVGVMPARFEFPVGRDMWVPRTFEGWEPRNRTARFWHVAGRLKPGVGAETAAAELDGIAAQLATEYPRTNAATGTAVVPLAEHLAGGASTTLLLFLGAVGLVLLIACVNVANLLLARAAQRQQEFAIRAAIGADRLRIMKQTITESLLLGAFGGVCGLVIAAVGIALFEPVQAASIPHAQAPGLDARALLFASALALGSTLLFGLMPALQIARNAALRERLHGGASAAPAARRFRSALVVSELALAMVLLVGAALLLRSFAAVLDVERGYRTDNVLAMSVQTWEYYPESAQRRLFVEQTLARIEQLPGVAAAGVTTSLPLAEGIGGDTATFTVVGRPQAADESPPGAHAAVVTEGYFRALGIPLRAGRMFGPTDGADAPRVIVINEALARRHWPGEDPVGARIMLGFSAAPVEAEVIGVVADVRDALQQDPQPSVFTSHVQQPTGSLYFAVHANGEPSAIVRAVQREIWAMNPAMPFAQVTTLDNLLDYSVRDRRSIMQIVVAFSVTALALAAVGAYGLVSHESSRRSHEIGIRVAIGASRRRVLALVVGDGLKLALLGIGVGGVLALVAGRAMQSFLFGVSAFDPLTFVVIALVMLAVTTLASFLPAWRAARADPIAALRP